VQVSVECLDFLNCCLRFDSKQWKDFNFLFEHPFILTSASSFSRATADTSNGASKLTYLHKISLNFKTSIELNTRTSIDLIKNFMS
jgi:hypothetical protein